MTASATLTVNTDPYAVAVNPVTSMVYVVNLAANSSASNGTVTAISETTNLATTIPVGASPQAIAVNSVTNMIYVANSEDNTVTVINGATNATTTLNVWADPTAIAVNSSTNMIYVTNSVANTVAVINGASNAVTSIPTGSNPDAVAVNQYTNTIYVTNGGSNSVTVINGATNATSTLPAGTNPVAVAIDPVTDMAYVANYGDYNYDQASSSTITVINGANNITSNVQVSGNPTSVAVNTVSHQVYVLAANNGPVVTVINEQTNATTPVTVYPSYVAPLALAVNSATNETYVLGPQYLTIINSNNQPQWQPITVNPTNPNAVVADSNTRKIFSINRVPWPDNGTVSVITETYVAYNAAISAGNNVIQTAMALNPTTQTLYVANSTWNNNEPIGTVSIIPELNPNATPQTMNVGQYPTAVAVNPSTNMVYVVDGDGFVTVINGGTLATQTVDTGSAPDALAINAQTNMIYVADGYSNQVTVINGATNATSTIGVGYEPSALVVNPQTNMIYVADWGYKGPLSMTVINGVTNATTTINLGTATVAATGAPSIALNPTTNMIYVANEIPGQVSVINGATNAVVATIPAGSAPNAIAVNPLTGLVYVTDGIDGLLTVIDGASNTVQKTFTSFPGAQWLAVDTTNNKIYVTSANVNSSVGSTVTIIDGGEYTTGVLQLPNTTGVTPITASVFDPLTGNIFAAGNNSAGTNGFVLAFQKPLALVMQEEALNPGASEELTPAALVQPQVRPTPVAPEWPNPIVPVNPVYPWATHTILLIHGRELDADNNLDVQFGGLTWDQSGHWGPDGPPATGARQSGQYWTSQVIYVQWDSWYQLFDSNKTGGGWAVIDSVMNQYCRVGVSENTTSDGCSVICHSAGCAALESWMQSFGFYNSDIYIDQIIEASSAADGSDIANIETSSLPAELLTNIWVKVAPIDQSLRTTYARSSTIDHNNMEGVPLYAVAGTTQNLPEEFLYILQCGVWPWITISGTYNGPCNNCSGVGAGVECHDTLVGLDSSCAHNQYGPYLSCESNINPFTEDSSTFDFHGYWGSVNYPCGLDCPPFSNTGQSEYNPTTHTYHTDHSGGKATAVQEYSYCNLNTKAEVCE